MREFLGGGFTAFPDLRFALTWALVAGERAAAEWTMSGTQAGDFTGLPATHEPFRVRGASVFELVGASCTVSATTGTSPRCSPGSA